MKENIQSQIQTLPINVDQFYVKCPPYFDTANNNIDYLVAHMKQDSPTPLCFVGPKGTGKTLVIAHYASENNIPIIQYDCSENTRKGDLIGRYVLRGDETAYQLGVLPSAIELANVTGKAILVLEELNALAPNMQKQLNQLLDWRRHVFADNGKTYTLNQGAKLLVCGTMNPSTYGGVFELNEDLISRWAQIWVEFPSQEEEESIAVMNGFNPKILPYTETGHQLKTEHIWRLVSETRTTDGLSYALSPRDIVQLLQGYETYLYNIFQKEEWIINEMGHSKTLNTDEVDKILDDFQETADPSSILNHKDFVLYYNGACYAFRMALNAFVIGKYQDSTEKETVRNRIDSVFGEKFLP